MLTLSIGPMDTMDVHWTHVKLLIMSIGVQWTQWTHCVHSMDKIDMFNGHNGRPLGPY